MITRTVNPETDDYREIAQLIYGTDPYIYPFWFDNVDHREAITHLIQTPGSVFYRDNLYIAVECGEIVGAMSYLHAGGNFSYDYAMERATQKNFLYTYENYLKPTIDQAKSAPSDTAVLFSACVLPRLRGKGYGKSLFCDVVYSLHNKKGFNHFIFDCLANNTAALKVYQYAGFTITGEGYGFNGFDPNKPPEVVWLEGHL